MKKLISFMLAFCLLFTIGYGFESGTSAAEIVQSPVISIEIGTYKDENERGFFSADTIRSGREKTSAKAGEKIVITFILSGMAKMEYFQLSGSFNQELLCAGYYTGTGDSAVWKAGDSEQDFNTVIDASESFSSGKFDDSFSFTRTDCEPKIYLCGYSLSGSVEVPSAAEFACGYTVAGMPLVSVGFEVLADISNIYDAFEWDVGSTTVSVNLDKNEYYLNSGLSVSCCHMYNMSVISPDCENDGYTLYSCAYCPSEFKDSYTDAMGHFYAVSQAVNDKFTYTCKSCSKQTSKTAQELYILWDIKYANKPPEGTSVNESCYLDVVCDGIINAKDYSQIVLRK